MSWCENCEMMVQTDYNTHFEWTEHLEYMHGNESCRGEYELGQVGDFLETKDSRWQIGVRIDHCMNCAQFIEMRTFARISNE